MNIIHFLFQFVINPHKQNNMMYNVKQGIFTQFCIRMWYCMRGPVIMSDLTRFEVEAIEIIKEAFSNEHIPFEEIGMERRSSDYLTLVCKTNNDFDRDFCRIKAGQISTWVSLDVWSGDNLIKDYRFMSVKNKNTRHWKIELDDVDSIRGITDLIIATYKYNVSSDGYTFNPIIKNNMPNENNFMKCKGKSLVEFPTNYIVFDIETTGLSNKWDEIIEISAIKIKDGIPSDDFNSLIKPENPISEFITELTGISNDMVSTAPLIKDVLPKFLDFVGNSILVGHNVNFDINFVYNACAKHLNGSLLSNDFVDTLKLSRHLLPDLDSHRLKDISEALGITYENAHRACNDCKFTYLCFEKMRKIADEKPELLQLAPRKRKARRPVKSADISTKNVEFDETNPIFGKKVVITGTLNEKTREEAMQIIADLGGINGDTVTRKTDFLVIGNNDYCKAIKDGKSTKQKKAENYILKGCNISIITEDMFYEMISQKEEK